MRPSISHLPVMIGVVAAAARLHMSEAIAPAEQIRLTYDYASSFLI